MATPAWWTLSHAQVAIEAIATVAFAASGLIEAARKKLDAVGVVVVAGLAAFGGGTLVEVAMRGMSRTAPTPMAQPLSIHS